MQEIAIRCTIALIILKKYHEAGIGLEILHFQYTIKSD